MTYGPDAQPATPPFKPGDRVTVRHNKPLGVLTVKRVETMLNGYGWWCVAYSEGCSFSGPATSLIPAQKQIRQLEGGE